MPKVMYDAENHRCQRMYGREYKDGKTSWTRTDFFYCPKCRKAYDEREMRVEDVDHVRVLSDGMLSVGIGEAEVPKGTVRDRKPDRNGFYTVRESELRELIGQEVMKHLRADGAKSRGKTGRK